MKKYIFCLCLFMGFESAAYAQRYDFKIYSVNDGLPHGQVHDILQTRNGYIWIATYGGGLSRFDGHSFTTFTTDHGLKSDGVQKLFEDSNGNLWVSVMPGGVVTFQGDSLINPFPGESLSHLGVYQIKELNKGEVWFGTNEGGIFILKDGQLSRLTTDDGLISNTVWDFWKDDDGAVWIATQEGISVMDGENVTNYTTEHGVSGNKIYMFADDHRGNKWIATSDGLTIWNGEGFKAIKEINGVRLGYVFAVVTASNGEVWIGTETKGVFVFDGKNYRHMTRKNGLSSRYIYTLYEDLDNNMWVATDENGVNLYKGDAFVYYDEDFGLSTNEVLSVLIDRNQVAWFGTINGIESYDGRSVRQHPMPGMYENNYIWEMEELPNGNLLFLMPDSLLMEYDGRQFHNYTLKNNLEKWFIFDLLVDSKGVLWIGTDEGLYKSDGTGVTRYTYEEDGMAGNVVHYIHEDDGRLLIGTTFGLSIYDGKEFKNIRVSDGLAHNIINYIVTDVEDKIWLGTGGGVSVLEPAADNASFTITNFGRKDGMRLVDTHFIWFDEDGYLWQGTNAGLNRLDVPEYRESGEMHITHFSLSDRGLGTEFNFKAIATDADDNVWFGSMDGVLKLDVSSLRMYQRENPPKVYITGIEKNFEPVPWGDFTDDLEYEYGALNYPSVTFPYEKDTYTFRFIGLESRDPENVRYRYKMDGYEDEWVVAKDANMATYTNLSPGDYTFTVQATKGAFHSEATTASYSFSIAYPFWRTYWFYALVLLGMTGLILGYIRIRIGILEKLRLKQLVDEKTKDLQEALAEKEVLIKEIHHRVKNNLAVISGLLELQRGYSDNEFAQRVLLESQLRVKSISMIHEKLYQNEKLSEIDFIKYVNELVDIISYSFSHQEKNITIDTNIDDIKLGVDQGIPCGLILNELVSNAYEHAFNGRDAGMIEVSLKKQKGSMLQLTVKDDGIGISKDFEELKSASLGLTLVETLTAQLKGTISVESSKMGTCFCLTFEKEQYGVRNV